MMVTRTDQLVDDYLARVARHAAALPSTRRDELLAELTEHIATARADTATPDEEATVRTILDRLGDPAEIVSQETLPPIRSATPERAWYRPLTIICLLFGGLVVPIVGWVVGVALLWCGGTWSTRQRVLGTVCTPGGFGAAALVAVLWLLFASGSDTGACQPGTECSTSDGSLDLLLVPGIAGLCAVASMVAAIVLARTRHQS